MYSFLFFACSSDKADNTIVSEILQDPPYVDLDGDGMSEEEGDCDDSDPWTFLGASDTWYDGVDSDCEGNDDYDQDRDGFISIEYKDFSDLPAGDCDDRNANIHPNAEDISVNDIDENCDGFDSVDRDGDGFADFFSGGTDCDDLDSTIVEIWQENLFHDEHLNGEIDFDIQKKIYYNADHQKIFEQEVYRTAQNINYVYEHVYQYNILGLLESHFLYQDENTDGNWDRITTTVFTYDIEQRLISESIEIDNDANLSIDTIHQNMWFYNDDLLVEFHEIEDTDGDGIPEHILEQFWEYDFNGLPTFSFSYVENPYVQYEEHINFEYVDVFLMATSVQKDNNIDGLVDFYSSCMWQYPEEIFVDTQIEYWDWSIEICENFSGSEYVSTQIHEHQFDDIGRMLWKQVEHRNGSQEFQSASEETWQYHSVFVDKIEEHTKTIYASSFDSISSIIQEESVFDTYQREIETYLYVDSNGDFFFDDYDGFAEFKTYSLCHE